METPSPSALMDRLDHHVAMREYEQAVALVQDTEGLAGLYGGDRDRAFRTVGAAASLSADDFQALLPLLEWFSQQGADPFGLPLDMSGSLYEMIVGDCWDSRHRRASDSLMAQWCWQSPQAPALMEASLSEQLSLDAFRCSLRSYRGRQLGSLAQLEGAKANGFDWNKRWSNGSTGVLMAIEASINPLDFTRDEEGKQRHDEWIEAFRGLRRLAKVTAPDSREAAGLFWLGEAWKEGMAQVARSMPSSVGGGTGLGERAPFWDKGMRTYEAFQKTLKSQWPEAYRDPFSPVGPWAQWLQERAHQPRAVVWARVAVWASMVRLDPTLIRFTSKGGASEEDGVGLDSPAGQAVLHQVAVMKAAGPLLETMDWGAKSPMVASHPNNRVWGEAWESFAGRLAVLTPSARQALYRDPALWLIVLPALPRIASPHQDTRLCELVQSMQMPVAESWKQALTMHQPSPLFESLCRSLQLTQSLPEPVRARSPRRF